MGPKGHTYGAEGSLMGQGSTYGAESAVMGQREHLWG